MKTTRLIMFLSLLLCSTALQAQTKRVTGESIYEITNITPEQARSNAIQEARFDALQKAGVPIRVEKIDQSIVSNIYSSFISISNTNIIGEITDEKVEAIKLVDNDKFFYRIKLHATVALKPSPKDPSFEVYINGFAPSYKDEDKLEFSLKSTKDCYVQIFWFDENGSGFLFYPSSDETAFLLQANREYSFPQSWTFDYTLRKYTRTSVEHTNFMFIFTKDYRPYTKINKEGQATIEEVYQWYIKIPADKRLIKNEVVVITKR